MLIATRLLLISTILSTLCMFQTHGFYIGSETCNRHCAVACNKKDFVEFACVSVDNPSYAVEVWDCVCLRANARQSLIDYFKKRTTANVSVSVFDK